MGVPDEFDCTPYTTPVRDQGNMGSCSSFAAATVKTYHERHDYGNMNMQMAPLFVYSWRSNYPSAGMTASDTWAILRDHGDCEESYLPYDDTESELHGSTLESDITSNAGLHKIDDVRYTWNAWTARTQSLDDFKAMVKENFVLYGPAWFAVSVYNYGCDLYKTPGVPMGGHAMTLVGYDAGGITFQNSWGVSWCNGGFSYITWEDAMEYIDEIDFYGDLDSADGSLNTTTMAPMPSFAPTAMGTDCLDVTLSTARYGNEISWTLDTCTSEQDYGNNQEYTQTCCWQTMPATMDLVCEDSYGDGWHGAEITVLGNTYCDNFMTGHSMAHTISSDGSAPDEDEAGCQGSSSFNGQCGFIDNTHVSCDEGCCTPFSFCTTNGFVCMLMPDSPYSDGGCPVSTEIQQSALVDEAVQTPISIPVYFLAFIGASSVLYYGVNAMCSRMKPYEQIDVVCDEEM